MTDIVIPLGAGSPFDNWELRFALRSVEKYVQDLNAVWIMSDCAPEWLQNVRILPVPDRHKHNKDANLFDKLIFAAKTQEVTDAFVFLSDDQAFLQPFDAKKAQIVFNPRGPGAFAGGRTKWHRRMTATFSFLAQRGIRLPYNFDAHVPVVYRKEDLKVLDGIDYATPPGYCINTLLCGLLQRRGEIPQGKVKAHAEGCTAEVDFAGKLYAGYNNGGFPLIREKLANLFPEKSRYEK
ncbi:MAG: hypothetical protein IKD46_04695 [Lentisphaeria bacterium]|nr:hypothetical protein [Lentisphaeria bacterium]